MIRNTFIAVLRNLGKSKTYTLLNLAGLTIAFGVLFMMAQFVYHHHSYDRQIPEVDHKYRVLLSLVRETGEPTTFATNFFPVGELIALEQPTIKAYTRLYMLDRHAAVTYDNKPLDQKGVGFADEHYIDFMGLQMLSGTGSALNQPGSAIVSRETASIVFGVDDPTGKQFYLDSEDGRYSLTVSGVFEELPQTSHVSPKILVSTESLKPMYAANDWRWNFFATYVEMQGTSLAPNFQTDFWSRHFPEYSTTSSIEMHFQPLLDVHLSDPYTYEYAQVESASVVLAMGAIGLAVLIIALVNYINLAATRSTTKARQAGIRKALGSDRWQLRLDALIEASMLVSGAMVLALTLLQLKLPFYLIGIDQSIDSSLYGYGLFWFANFGLLALSILVCGWYPSQLAAGVKLTTALSGKTKVSVGSVKARGYLVFLQFSLAFIILVGAITVRHQFYYIMSQKQVLDTNQVLVINGPRNVEGEVVTASVFHEGLSEIPGVDRAAMSTSIPGIWMGTATDVKMLPANAEEGSTVQVYGANEDYLDVFGIEVLVGRNFSSSLKSDENAVLVNESALVKLGIAKPEEALNQKIKMGRGEWKIIGVLKDYHHASMKQEIPPIVIRYRDNDVDYFSVSLTGDMAAKNEALAMLESRWNEIYPLNPFEYYFHDTLFDQIYRSEHQAQKLFTFLSIIAIILAAMGLVGLMNVVIFQKQKEIGIRKTLGASFMQVSGALSKDTFRIMLIAFGVSIPLALWLVHEWLQTYAYHITPSWFHFLIPVIIISTISILSIAGIMLRASRINPVDILRNE